LKSSAVTEGLAPSAEPPGAKVFYVFGRAYMSVSAYLEAGITARGLYMSDFHVLEILLHKGPLTAAAITDKLFYTGGSITPSVDRLETLGYVRRPHAGKNTRRLSTIKLTKSGHTLIEEIFRQHAGDIERVLHPLSGWERLQLYRISKKIGLYSERLQLTRFKDRPGSLSPSQVRRATKHLSNYTGNVPSVGEVAAKLGLSSSRFSRGFKASTGLPPHRWQLNLRIAKAQELLRYGGLSLTEITLATGFAEQSHFTRVFKKVVGVSPGSWQRDHQQ
jgi:AraC-like DNA-binding protein